MKLSGESHEYGYKVEDMFCALRSTGGSEKGFNRVIRCVKSGGAQACEFAQHVRPNRVAEPATVRVSSGSSNHIQLGAKSTVGRPETMEDFFIQGTEWMKSSCPKEASIQSVMQVIEPGSTN